MPALFSLLAVMPLAIAAFIGCTRGSDRPRLFRPHPFPDLRPLSPPVATALGGEATNLRIAVPA